MTRLPFEGGRVCGTCRIPDREGWGCLTHEPNQLAFECFGGKSNADIQPVLACNTLFRCLDFQFMPDQVLLLTTSMR